MKQIPFSLYKTFVLLIEFALLILANGCAIINIYIQQTQQDDVLCNMMLVQSHFEYARLH